jgi:hypothetical protein
MAFIFGILPSFSESSHDVYRETANESVKLLVVQVAVNSVQVNDLQ